MCGDIFVFFLFFAVWMLLNGKISAEIIIFGLIISAAVYIFCCRFMHYSPKKDLDCLKRLPRLAVLFFVLLREIFKSAFALLPYVYGGRKPDPAVVRFTPDGVESDMGKVFLGNCITMTPGTITGSLKDSTYLVHCLDRSMGEGLESSAFVRAIRRWEGK